jgi:hypothetical protein
MEKREVAQFNENQFNAVFNEVESKIEFVQGFVDRYKKFNLSPLNGDELQELFNNPKELFIKKLSSGEKISIKGMELNNDKLFDLLEKPKEMISLLEELVNFSKDRAQTNFYQIRNYIVTDNVVSVNENFLNSLKEANTVYLENDKQKKAFHSVNNVLNALNELKSIYNFDFRFLEKNIKDSNGKFVLDASFLKAIK